MAAMHVFVATLVAFGCTIDAARSDKWQHGWNTAQDSWWGDFGHTLLTEAQAHFLATKYQLVSLEKCTGHSEGLLTEDGIYHNAKMLKAANSSVKVAFYWSTELMGLSCYGANATFMAHPEWWLRDDHGNVVNDKGTLQLDVTNEAAVQWWLSVPFSRNGTAELIDGVLADGSGYKRMANISDSRLNALWQAKLEMVAQLQHKFDVLNGGVVFGNGLSEYDMNPADPHNFQILNHTRGVQNEHFAAFEQVVSSTGALRLDKVANVLDNVQYLANRNASQVVFCSFWAGPYVGSSKNGFPYFAGGKQPTGTRAEVFKGWQQLLLKYLPFNLAAFLSVAESNVYMAQSVWYSLNLGFVPCPEDPASCAAPPNWYPLLSKPLGAPKAPRKQVGSYKWTREFEHAFVTLDLNSPLNGTNIVWHDGSSFDGSSL